MVPVSREGLFVWGAPRARSRTAQGTLKEKAMKTVKNLLTKLAKDEQGGEVLEYALIAGLIIVGAIALIASVGDKVLARWTSLNTSL